MKKLRKKVRLPEWAPQNADKSFTSRVISTDPGTNPGNNKTIKVQPPIYSTIDEIFDGVLCSNRTALSKAITLIESNSPKHFQIAQNLVNKLLPHSGNSLRIGITGVPGAGKSTFIEYFGSWLIEQGHKVAVLAIDPSSIISKGSILGDKTRMEKLSRSDNSFIRPSPTSGVLGGVARKTRETIIACEAAGYDIILIETVGVGQSEITVRSMVDIFLLFQITGAGDDLQVIKKGIVELADLIIINKADRHNVLSAEKTQAEINQILHYLQPVTKGWIVKAITCSALLGTNIPELWDLITAFKHLTEDNGYFYQRRKEQNLEWLDLMLMESLRVKFFDNKIIADKYKDIKNKVISGEITPTSGVADLITNFTDF